MKSNANSDKAYQDLRKWAERVGSSLPDTPFANERLRAFSQAVAALRLSRNPSPEEPDPEAVQTLLDDPAAWRGDVSDRGANKSRAEILEEMICASSRELIKATENQPYFGCGGRSKEK